MSNDDTYDFAGLIPAPGPTFEPATDWLLPDGLVVGDVRHEAARGPLWPALWTPVRRAVLEVVL